MIVGLTNDDGIDAYGIEVLVDTFGRRGHEPVVVAPAGERSGSGTGLGKVGEGDAFVVKRRVISGVTWVAIDSTPAMCVLAALRGVGGAIPELVVSGINHGPNLGLAVLHSGTVGAALTAHMAGKPALAVSVGEPGTALHSGAPNRGDSVWAAAADLTVDLAEQAGRTRPGAVFNVNVPSLWDKTCSPRWARLAEIGAIELSTGDESMTVRLAGAADLVASSSTDLWPTDVVLNGRGLVTVTPLGGLMIVPIGFTAPSGSRARFTLAGLP